MSVDVQRLRSEEVSSRDRVYSPDTLPRLQSLLAILADIDVTYEKKLDAIEHNPGDPNLKRKMIAALWQNHQKRRALYAAELEGLQEQIRSNFG